MRSRIPYLRVVLPISIPAKNNSSVVMTKFSVVNSVSGFCFSWGAGEEHRAKQRLGQFSGYPGLRPPPPASSDGDLASAG